MSLTVYLQPRGGPSLSSAEGSSYLWLTLEQEGNGIVFCTLHEYETSTTSERPLACQCLLSQLGAVAVLAQMYYRYIAQFVSS